MAQENLPNDFDIIIVGTGLSEAILSGALSRIGKKVLHLDHNKHYGSSWSSFNLKAFETWIKQDDENLVVNEELQKAALKKVGEDELFLPIHSVRETTERGVASSCFLEESIVEEATVDDITSKTESLLAEQDRVEKTNDESGDKEEDAGQSSKESADTTFSADAAKEFEGKDANEELSDTCGIINNDFTPKKPELKDPFNKKSFYESWRQFNLDLAPKLMFSRGKLVELLITSNVSRYLEFRNVTRTLTLLDDDRASHRLAPVPCSRTDVFNSKFVTMIEKRMLMRVLTMCANFENHPEEYKDCEDGRFVDFLATKKLSKKLQHFILHSIAMVTEDANTLEGLKATQKFLKSLGRYGNSAWLWPLYGVGELPQAFCRLSAVFGGTFCLDRSLTGLVINKETGDGVGIIDSRGQRIECKHLILDECYLPESHRVPFKNVVSRAIYVTNKSLLAAENENISLITIPPSIDLPSSRLIEVGPSSCVCPPKYFVVHAMTSVSPLEGDLLPSPKSKFESIEKILFQKAGGEDVRQESNAAEKGEDSKPKVLWASYFNMMSGGANVNNLPNNVYSTRGPSMDLGFDETVLEAKGLFETICPEEEFLPRAPNPEEIVYFDHDDEGYNTETNGNPTSSPPDDGGEYQEDDSEVEAGRGEPDDHDAVHTAEVPPAGEARSEDATT